MPQLVGEHVAGVIDHVVLDLFHAIQHVGAVLDDGFLEEVDVVDSDGDVERELGLGKHRLGDRGGGRGACA